MRGIHLIESARSEQSMSGLPGFLSLSAHGALVLAAVYATTQPALPRAGLAPDARVYFTPEPRPAPAPVKVAHRQQRQNEPAATSAVQAKAPSATADVPTVIPAADVPLGDPVVAAPPTGGEGAASSPGTDAGQLGGDRTFGEAEVEVPAAALSAAGPEYPERAIRLGLSGRVSARFIVGKDGRVEEEVIILSATTRDFATAVRDYLRHTGYRAARVGGEPVRQLVEQEFVFRLRQ